MDRYSKNIIRIQNSSSDEPPMSNIERMNRIIRLNCVKHLVP